MWTLFERKVGSKWHGIGYELTEPDINLAHLVSKSEKTLNTLIGRSLVPSYPLTILTILQTMEAATLPPSGSYGYLYEALITDSLSHAPNKAASLDTKYMYLARLAHAMYEADSQYITQEQVEEVTDEYHRMFAIRFNEDQILNELDAASLIERRQGKIKFNTSTFIATSLLVTFGITLDR